MPLLFSSFTNRGLVQAHPDWLFIFGDNLGQYGLGGQAKELRGEPNSIGLPTKRNPAMREEDFFTDLDFQLVKINTKPKFNIINYAVRCGKYVVWPLDGIGTGLAQLPQRAPAIAQFYHFKLEALKKMSIISLPLPQRPAR